MITEIMLDLETLSLHPTAAVWQFGACLMPMMDTVSQLDADTETAKLTADTRLLDPKEQAELAAAGKVDVDPDTVSWSIQQDNEKGTGFFEWQSNFSAESSNVQSPMLTTSVRQLHAFMKNIMHDEQPTFFWAKNAAFDFPILTNLFASCGLRAPWHHRNTRCLYTLKQDAEWLSRITGVPLQPFEMENEMSHTAGADCVHQTHEVLHWRRQMRRAAIRV